MKLEAARILADANPYDPTTKKGLSLMEHYSGRCMYGEHTAAVHGHPSDFHSTIAKLLHTGSMGDRQLVAEAFRDLRSDDFGKGMIYY